MKLDLHHSHPHLPKLSAYTWEPQRRVDASSLQRNLYKLLNVTSGPTWNMHYLARTLIFHGKAVLPFVPVKPASSARIHCPGYRFMREVHARLAVLFSNVSRSYCTKQLNRFLGSVDQQRSLQWSNISISDRIKIRIIQPWSYMCMWHRLRQNKKKIALNNIY
jgi:hypothetical protein